MNILVTGAAGFIGFHTVISLINKNKVIGIDNMNSYYNVDLKKNRIKEILKKGKNFLFYKVDLRNFNKIDKIIKQNNIKYIIHLAAQAGVRHSLKKPEDYLSNNIFGTFNILKIAKKNKIKHLVIASTSSVYGNQINMPFKENSSTSRPIQFYAATKKSTEVMAHAYSHMYKIPITIMRFFTVYGPWGRPDMALFDFTKKIINHKTISVFNRGNHSRDFTYVEDVANGLVKILKLIPKKNKKSVHLEDPSVSDAPFKIYNIGNGKPVRLMRFIREIEKNLGVKANIKYLPMQLGDIKSTHASTKKLKKDSGYVASTNVETGIKKFIDWFKSYYNKNNLWKF